MFIPDPNFFSIPDPGSTTKNLSNLTQKTVFQHSEIWSWLFTPDPDFLPIPDPRSRGQKGTGSRIRNTVTYHPMRSALGVSSSSRWLVGWFPSIFTSKQTRPLSAPCVARTPAHMYPNPSLEIAFTLQKSAVPIFKLRSESSKKKDT